MSEGREEGGEERGGERRGGSERESQWEGGREKERLRMVCV